MTEILATGPATFAVREVALAEARALARRGRYAEARRLLDEAWNGAEPSAACLDLQARIHAQQNRLEEADSCWARAELLQPGEPEFAAARRRIARMRGGRAERLALARWLRYVVLLAVAAVAVALLVAIRSDVARTHREQEAVARRLDRLSQVRPSTAPPTPDVLAALGHEARLPGVRVRRLPDEVEITFTTGLFGTGAVLTPRGRAVVERFGTRLRPYADRIVVSVVGHTDSRTAGSGTGYAGNMELGTVRAVVVREVLRTASGIPTARFSVSSLGSALPPFRQPARNRTVSLRISAR